MQSRDAYDILGPHVGHEVSIVQENEHIGLRCDTCTAHHPITGPVILLAGRADDESSVRLG